MKRENEQMAEDKEMNCAGYIAWIARKIQGTLPADQARDLDSHMEKCPRCREELYLQKAIHESLKREMPSGLSPDFTKRVSREILSVESPERRPLRLPDLMPVFALAAVAIVIVAFRAPIGQGISGPVEWFGGTIASGMETLGELILAMAGRLPEVSGEHLASVEIAFSPLATTIAASGLACLTVVWSLLRVKTFLRS
jgi:anti-sigma factor RsiW